jgi:hypothetical protein
MCLTYSVLVETERRIPSTKTNRIKRIMMTRAIPRPAIVDEAHRTARLRAL